MNGSQVPLEDIGAVKGLLRGRAGTRAETAHHSSLVVGEGVTILVVPEFRLVSSCLPVRMPVLILLACEALNVIFASDDRALLRPLALVSEHVRLEILEVLAAIGVRASLLLPRLVAAIRLLRRAI